MFYCTDVGAGITLLPSFVKDSSVLGLNAIFLLSKPTCAFAGFDGMEASDQLEAL